MLSHAAMQHSYRAFSQHTQAAGVFLRMYKRINHYYYAAIFLRDFLISLVIAAVCKTLYDVNIVSHKTKKAAFEQPLSGPDGTRTRDLRRDRAAF
jgi:hypothetical protein